MNFQGKENNIDVLLITENKYIHGQELLDLREKRNTKKRGRISTWTICSSFMLSEMKHPDTMPRSEYNCKHIDT